MEIKDYLKVLGKRAWLLVMIPAVAGVVAGLIAVAPTPGLPHHRDAPAAARRHLVAGGGGPAGGRLPGCGQQPDRAEPGVRGHRRAGQAHQAAEDHPGGRLQPADAGLPGQEAQRHGRQGGHPRRHRWRARLPAGAAGPGRPAGRRCRQRQDREGPGGPRERQHPAGSDLRRARVPSTQRSDLKLARQLELRPRHRGREAGRGRGQHGRGRQPPRIPAAGRPPSDRRLSLGLPQVASVGDARSRTRRRR